MSEVVTKFDFSKGNWDALMDSFGDAILQSEDFVSLIFEEGEEQVIKVRAYYKLIGKLFRTSPERVVKITFGRGLNIYVHKNTRFEIIPEKNIPENELHWLRK